MAKKKRDRKIQKKIQITNASVASPPYETNSNKYNTKQSMTDNHNKNEHFNSKLCFCESTIRPKTWQSITGMYDDHKTKKIWDSNDQKSLPKPLQKNKMKYMKQRQTNKVKKSISLSKYNNNKKYTKKSKGLYRKHENRINSLKTQQNHNIDDKVVKDETPIIQFKISKKPKLKGGTLTNHEGTGDSCIDRPCMINNNYKPQEIKSSVDIKRNVDKRTIKAKKPTKESRGDKGRSTKGYGDFISPVTFEKSNENTHKGSFLNKIKKITSIHKNNNEQSNKPLAKSREPLFVMKVDSKEMRVLNPFEINKNVKKFGISKKHQCICPSRLNNSKNMCDNRICKRPLTNNHVRFSCKCAKNNLTECKDTTCDLQEKLKHDKNKKKSPKHIDQNNPLFQIMLDPNMSILNSYEVLDIFNKTEKEICPTGICSVAAKNRSKELNCKCVSKKIKPEITECSNITSQPKRRSTISSFCSRIFSKSDNLGPPKRIITNTLIEDSIERKKKGNLKVQSDAYYQRNGQLLNVSREHKRARDDQKDIWCKCFCECDETTRIERKKNHQLATKGVKGRKSQKSKTKVKKSFVSRKQKRRQIEPLTFQAYLVKYLQRKRARFYKKTVEKEKELNKNEKKLKKQLLKEKRKREKIMKADAQNWNCLTNFVNGVLNLVTQSIKNILSAIFSIITNPFGSFVYLKQRVFDPPGTMQRIANWIEMTWTNKSTKLSQSVKESQAMNVIADQIENSVVYDKLFANKGRTAKERRAYEKKNRLRKRRIQKRHDEALYGCRHMLLTTMRKTPHLWFYHICPDLYPQCLSLVAFMKNFFHILIYLLAFLCWTPCIVSFELCRAFLCCFLCTH